MYRLIFGAVLLAALYTGAHYVIYGLIVMLAIEGVTNARVPAVVTRLRMRHRGRRRVPEDPIPVVKTRHVRFNFAAERAWRLVAAVLLLLGMVGIHSVCWFIPWFMGFGIFGAGVSGVCPMLISVEWLGFR